MTLQASIELKLGTLSLDAVLDAGPAEIVVILGPNGAGKTTLLRALAGLEPLDWGRVILDGQVLDDPAGGVRMPTERRPIGFVFQDYLLFQHMSVADNVAFGLRARGMRRATADKRALEWLERMGLASDAASSPAALSGGQAQRVALARALAPGPRMLLLDEPLAALDAGARDEIRRALKRHLTSFEGIRLIVTHDPIEAMLLGDRLVVLEGGRIVQTGTMEELRRAPRSFYVANLVRLNLYRGQGRGDHIVLDTGVAIAAPGSGTGGVFAAIHPTAVAVYRSRPEGSPRNVWPGRVASVDLEGDRARVRVEGALEIVAEVTAAAVADLGLAEGQAVWAAVKATEVSVYPA